MSPGGPSRKGWPKDQPVRPLQVWGLLNDTPAVDYPDVYPLPDCVRRRTLGFRDRVAHKQKKTEHLHQQLPDIEIFGKKFNYVFPTIADVYERTQRFDVLIPEYEEAKVEQWLHYLRQSYPYLQSTRTHDFDEIYVRPDSAPGPLAEGCCSKTRDLLRWFMRRVWSYWEKAPKEGWPVFWKTSGKVEMLPKGKKPRTFVFMDKFMNMCFTRVCADFNDLMKADRHHTMNAIGMSIYGWEWRDLGEELAKFKWVLEADVSEWDARMGATMFEAIKRFRAESMQDAYGKVWLEYKYEIMRFPLIFLPSGELVEVAHGNMSGQDSTSTDNTLGHSVLVVEAVNKTLDKDPKFQHFIKLYSDDFIGGISSKKHFPEILKSIYIENSFVVKPNAFKLHRGLEGATFLGGKFKHCELHGFWTYVPSKQKLLESLAATVGEMSDVELYNKVFSLFILAFHTKWKERFRSYYLRVRKLLKSPPQHWTDQEIEAFVHGLEGPSAQVDRLYFDPGR